MNWEHFKAFVWLRRRLLRNQWRRAGKFNAVVMGIIAVASIVTVIPLFLGGFALAAHLIPRAKPLHLLLVWDGILFFFLLFWGVGLITELQRNDPLSLSKFMHLPVSPNGAFIINYLSSLMRLSLMFFGPIMLAFALALVYVQGPSQLITLALLAAFLLMVTGLTYQFQGWLAALMSNPRRRRTIIVGMTMAFVLVFQLPNLLNVYAPWNSKPKVNRAAAIVERTSKFEEESMKLQRQLAAKEIDSREFIRRTTELMNREKELAEQEKLAIQQKDRDEDEALGAIVKLANAVVPVGWLPLGVMTAAEGRFLPGILGLLGMTSIGTFSLWRAYRTSVGQFQGQSSNRPAQAAVETPVEAVTAKPAVAGKRGTLLLEAKIPWLSEPVSGIALGGLRSLLRAPEAKMTLLSPIIMCGVFGTMMVKNGRNFPETFRLPGAIGGIALLLMGLLQLTANQFGFDRDGFRVFVLCAASRRDILLGKNLSFAPLALGMGAFLVIFIQILCPMRLDHFLSTFPLLISMFLMFCLFTNLMSIYTPVYMAPGSLKPTNPKTTTVLLQVVMFLLIFPITQAPAFLPFGAEMLSKLLGWTDQTPVCLLLSILECVVVVFLYRLILKWQGGELQFREQKILETVTNRAV